MTGPAAAPAPDAAREGYGWAQTAAEVCVAVPAPAGMRARHMRVEIRSASLQLALPPAARAARPPTGGKHTAGRRPGPAAGCGGALGGGVLPDDSCWELADEWPAAMGERAGAPAGGRVAVVTLRNAAPGAFSGALARRVRPLPPPPPPPSFLCAMQRTHSGARLRLEFARPDARAGKAMRETREEEERAWRALVAEVNGEFELSICEDGKR
eukprot:gene6946-19174_t